MVRVIAHATSFRYAPTNQVARNPTRSAPARRRHWPAGPPIDFIQNCPRTRPLTSYACMQAGGWQAGYL